jgi:hypothetical protein
MCWNISYCVLGTVNIESQLDSAYRRSVKEHNEKVSRFAKQIGIYCLFYTVKEIDEFFDLEFIVACNT